MQENGIITFLIRVSKLGKAFHDTFMKRWGTKRDPRLLLVQFNEMKKKENESVKEFDTRFENLLNQIPDDIIQRMVSSFFNIQIPLRGNLDLCLGTSPQRPL
jgi:hypothetical protein